MTLDEMLAQNKKDYASGSDTMLGLGGNYLNDNKIPCGVYYPVPLHKQKAYAKANVDSSAFSVTNQLVKEVISLPMHSELSIDQIEYICDKILCFFD